MIDTVFGIGLGLLIALVFHSLIPCAEQRELKEQALQHKAAYYHPTTGELTWK